MERYEDWEESGADTIGQAGFSCSAYSDIGRRSLTSGNDAGRVNDRDDHLFDSGVFPIYDPEPDVASVQWPGHRVRDYSESPSSETDACTRYSYGGLWAW